MLSLKSFPHHRPCSLLFSKMPVTSFASLLNFFQYNASWLCLWESSASLDDTRGVVKAPCDASANAVIICVSRQGRQGWVQTHSCRHPKEEWHGCEQQFFRWVHLYYHCIHDPKEEPWLQVHVLMQCQHQHAPQGVINELDMIRKVDTLNHGSTNLIIKLVTWAHLVAMKVVKSYGPNMCLPLFPNVVGCNIPKTFQVHISYEFLFLFHTSMLYEVFVR